MLNLDEEVAQLYYKKSCVKELSIGLLTAELCTMAITPVAVVIPMMLVSYVRQVKHKLPYVSLVFTGCSALTC